MVEFTSHAKVISMVMKHKLLSPVLKDHGGSVKGGFAPTALDQLCTDTDPLTPQSVTTQEDSSRLKSDAKQNYLKGHGRK